MELNDTSNGYVDFSVVSESANYIHILIRNLYGLNVHHMQYLRDVHGIKILHSGHNGHYYGEKISKELQQVFHPIAPLFWLDDSLFQKPPYEITSKKEWDRQHLGDFSGESNKED